MGKIKENRKKKRLAKTLDLIPDNKIDFVQEILDNIISLIDTEGTTEKSQKANIKELLKLSGSIKLPKGFDSLAYQKKLRNEW